MDQVELRRMRRLNEPFYTCERYTSKFHNKTELVIVFVSHTRQNAPEYTVTFFSFGHDAVLALLS